jgi:hypothetical protein
MPISSVQSYFEMIIQNQSLQQELKQWKKEYDLLDACIELMQMGKDERDCILQNPKKKS